MNDLTTIRIYFEYGQKIKNQSLWEKISSSDFSTEIMKRAKKFDLQQILHLNVTKGYFDNQSIKWGITEVRHYKHPHIIEITDSVSKVNQFLNEQDHFLKETRILIVKNEVLIK